MSNALAGKPFPGFNYDKYNCHEYVSTNKSLFGPVFLFLWHTLGGKMVGAISVVYMHNVIRNFKMASKAFSCVASTPALRRVPLVLCSHQHLAPAFYFSCSNWHIDTSCHGFRLCLPDNQNTQSLLTPCEGHICICESSLVKCLFKSSVHSGMMCWLIG